MTRKWWNEAPGKMVRRLNNVWLHDVTDRMRLRRRAIAAADGIDPDEVETYPMSGDVTIVHQESSGLRSLASAAALLALGGTGGLIGAGAMHWLQPSETIPTPPPPPVLEEIVSPHEYRIQFWMEDEATLDIRPAEPVEN